MTQAAPRTPPRLFTPIRLRDVELRNRILLSPMAMYVADEGRVNGFHRTHYEKFAMGGVGLVMVEQTAVRRRGRISNGCLGLWDDAQLPGMTDLVAGIHRHGARAGIQISHGGRKASAQRAWRGNGPLTDADLAAGDMPWTPEGPDGRPFAEGWPAPEPLSVDGIGTIVADFRAAALRAVAAGFDLVELHLAHGYLLQSFLSPVSNHRTDQYGGSLENRMRLPLEIAETLRAALPEGMPLLARISATDWIEGGWTIEDSLVLSRALKARGVDVIDCSSGGNLVRGATNSSLGRGPGYQVPFAHRIRAEVGVPTIAVGKIMNGAQAERILAEGSADLIAIGRPLLYDPFWALHAARDLGWDMAFGLWPRPYGWWLDKWARSLEGGADGADAPPALQA